MVKVGQGAAISAQNTVTTDANGAFQTSLTIPAQAAAGSVWTITAAPASGPVVNVQFQVSAQTPSGLYTVRGGDTMNGIASQFQTSGDAIIRANADIGPGSLLHTGQQLYMPGTTVGIDGRSVYIVKAGDTLLRISRERGTSLAAVLQANPGLAETTILYPGDHIVLP
jgi:LysM repeat protein